MIGYKLKTKQTTGDGVTVNRIMVAESLDIARETYFAIMMDRSHQGPVMVGSPAGGMDIEEVAATTPEKIFKVRGEERERREKGRSWERMGEEVEKREGGGGIEEEDTNRKERDLLTYMSLFVM